MSDINIIREVEEELRRERLQKMWQIYGPYLLGAALLIIVGVAGYKGWQYWQQSVAASTGTRFDSALKLIDEGKTEEAGKALAEIGASGPAGYRTLALLRQAAQKASAGTADEAVAAYDAIAADGATDPVLRGFARIAAAGLLVDKVDSTAIENRLKDLDVEEEPWRHAARELLALAAFRAGQIEAAERQFTAILVDAAAPQGTRRRAEMMMSLIVADKAKTGG